jgi:hypothetical protein
LTPLNRTIFSTLALGLAISIQISAQTPAPQAAAPQQPATPQEPAAQDQLPPPKGTVLFERHADPDADPSSAPPAATPPAQAAPKAEADEKLSGSALSDDERGAITITRYDLDARLAPATSSLEMRARVDLHNDSDKPLTRVALQISSTLIWQSATLLDATRTRLNLVQHAIDTDTDHTGKATEAILELPQPLAPGTSLSLDLLYGGTLTASGDRLERIGATHEQALNADWDAIAPESIALRGFGNVLWYPVASPQLFLGDGAKLFQGIGAMRLREQNASVRLRVSVEFQGEAPVAVYFCGRRQPLKPLSDNSDAPVVSASGVATADFPAAPLGFRPLSLFTVEHNETLTTPLAPTANQSDLLAVETHDEAAIPRLSDSAKTLAPMLQVWFGAHPTSALTLIDHEGQPFEDGPLLVAPMNAISSSTGSEALLHSLTHAWVETGQPWMDEGLAEFMTLVYTEQTHGREAANNALHELMRPLILAEPAPDASKADNSGQPLITATDEIYYRRKAAGAWWALRSITSDDSLAIALAALASQTPSSASPRDQALAFQHLLEKSSHKDLGWFFEDYVFHDKGLPDLSITAVTPRPLPAGKGHDTGWLVAVTVHNDGAAAAQVPLIVRSGQLDVMRTIRVPGLSDATERVVVNAKPTQVQVNDGSVSEMNQSQHIANVTVQEH